MMMDVLLVALVQGQVAVIFLQVMSLLLLLVVVKVFVVEVQEALLFSLSSTPPPRTRPAGRCLGLGRSGVRFPVCGPCTRQALFWTLFLKHGPWLS